MGRSLGSASACEIINNYENDIDACIIESGFAEETPLFNLIGTTAENIGFKKDYGLL